MRTEVCGKRFHIQYSIAKLHSSCLAYERVFISRAHAAARKSIALSLFTLASWASMAACNAAPNSLNA